MTTKININEVIRFVIDSGRVVGEGEEWADSLAIEVEFEAVWRGATAEDAVAMGAEAARRYS